MTKGTAVEALAARLNSAAVRLVRRIAREDGRDGLTRARASALSVLVFGGPLPIGALALAEMVSGPTMTRIVDGMARAGLVRRDSPAEDRRRVVITATPRGRRLIERARARRIRRLTAELDRLERNERDVLDRAAAILARLEIPRRETT